MTYEDYLYPEIEPYRTGVLAVSNRHTLYFEEVGNPEGMPVVYLHGGPGGGISALSRRFYDPAFYRIILFDQRGAGKSTPYADLTENTTWDLVADIEKIRTYLGIEKWLVFGGSWGSTLALAYAITHPDKVVGLILRGIFLARKKEIHWFYQSGASNIFPDFWQGFIQPIPVEEQNDLVGSYYRRLTSENQATQIEAAKAWSKWEAATSRLFPDEIAIQRFDDPQEALSFARIECHYFINDAFMESDYFLLEKAKDLSSIPCRIIQGRYDMVCPIVTAWELKQAMPWADMRIIPDAGHSIKEPGVAKELIQATNDFKKHF